MAHDVVIRGGTVIDGLAAEPYLADVAINAGRVTAIGPSVGDAEDVIDASGAIVTPGFIDLHTHLDAQIGWDNRLTPSSWHGVTTALMGNCGMTFAPVRPGEGRVLSEMVEAVEDIPASAIEHGLAWTWESFGEFLDYVERCQPIFNLAAMVGHCTLRYYAMGERAVDGVADASDIAELARLASRALDEGAAGFSTSRWPGHRLRDRRCVPGTYATRQELCAIADVVRGRGLFQAVLNTGDLEPDMDLFTDIGVITGGRVLLASAAVDPPSNDGTGTKDASTSVPMHYQQPTPAMLDAAFARGANITATLMPREGGAICGLFAKLPWRSPAWDRLDAMPHTQRLIAVADVGFRHTLIEQAAGARTVAPLEHIFDMGDEVARYMAGPDRCLASLAAGAGVSPAEWFLRRADDTDGRAMWSAVMFNRNADVLQEMLTSERFVPGLGDAGAHLAHIVDASYTTFFLSHWARDAGLVSLGEAVKRLTSIPADLLGLSDRGRLVVGSRADVNIIDLPSLAVLRVEPEYDAPLGSARLIQRARGYRATLVNGRAIIRDDEHTGVLAGEVLREFAGRSAS